jgi:hypothetical protein
MLSHTFLSMFLGWIAAFSRNNTWGHTALFCCKKQT